MDSWLEKGYLQKPVHGPVAMLLQVSDPAIASMVEGHCKFNKLLSFLTETESDLVFLKQELREKMHLECNTFTILFIFGMRILSILLFSMFVNSFLIVFPIAF